MLKSQIRIETGDKNARNEGLILLFCSVIKVSTNTNDFVNQLITENKGFALPKHFCGISVTDSTASQTLHLQHLEHIFYQNEVHLYKQMLYRDIWMETSM